MTVPPLDTMPGTCSVKFEHADGWVTNEFSTAGDLVSDMPNYNDRHNHYARVSGCQGHGVMATEHSSDLSRNQEVYFFRDGFHHLGTLVNELTGVRIKKIPLDDSTKMVGFGNYNNLCERGDHASRNHTWTTDMWTGLCPNGGDLIHLNCVGGLYACAYNKDETVLRNSVSASVKPDMINRLCNKPENLAFQITPNELCAHHTAGKAIANEYCKTGDNFTSDTVVCSPNGLKNAGGYGEILRWHCAKGANIKEGMCDVTINANDNKLSRTDYDTIATAFCEANPNDAWCGCYNVVNNKCADDVITGPMAGCKETKNYVNLRNKTPVDQRDVWDGQRKCGSICSGNKYLPPENQAGCKSTIQICAQTITASGLTDSQIDAACQLNAEGPSGVDDGSGDGDKDMPSAADIIAAENLKKAKSELAAAEAAVAAGEPGAAERLAAAKGNLDAAEDEVGGDEGLAAYIPKSLEGLKTDQKQQIGAGAMGAIVIGCMMMMLLLLMSGGGGGGGAPVRRRFR